MVADTNEIRCPMCGKPNPAENDVCQFCQARLKPLTGPISESPGGREEDDWLGSLRSEGDLSESADSDWIDDGESLSDDQRDPLDWLSNLDGQTSMHHSEPPAAAEPEPARRDIESPSEAQQDEEVDLSAWLASLDEEEAEAASSQPTNKVSEDMPEWLTDFQRASSEAEPDDDELPEWLTGSEPEAQPEAMPEPEEEPEAEPEPDDALPDWLTEIGAGSADVDASAETSSEAQAAAEPLETGELPDWLGSMGAASDEAQEVSEVSADAGELGGEDEALPDWLSEIETSSATGEEPADIESGAQAADAPINAGELPDWLAAMSPEAGEDQSVPLELADTGELGAVPEAEPEAALSDEQELSEWLEEVLPGDLAEESPELADADLPDWLGEVPASEPAGEVDGETEVGEERAADIADWMAAAATELPAGEITQPESVDFLSEGFEDLEIPGEAAPDARASAAPDAAEAAEELPEEAQEADEIPDWLEDIAPAAGAVAAGLAAANLAASEDEPSDWLSELASDVEGGVDSSEKGAETAAGTNVPFVGDTDLDQDLESLDLLAEPDWLADVTDEAAAEQREDEESDIERANLPEWLAAMRPVDSIVAPQALDEEGPMEAESSGPLVGLHDVLPAEQFLFEISRPEAHTIKLDVTENQRKHIGMLQQMLKQEEYAPAAGRETPRVIPQRIYRWIIALVLIFTAIFGLFSGTQISEVPVAGAEILAVSKTIDSLPAQAPVLVAVDYEPGLSAEMDAVAEALLNHLMLRGARLTLVSSTPTGPLLGEMTLETLLSEHDYARGAQYVNLGYIPGGATGLQSLADYPLRLTLPFTFSGFEPWEPRLAPLAGVEQISDFAAVLVLSDRQETARAWIEQIGPALQAPLLFGSSAQISPLVSPYFGEGFNLVDGYVAGIAGSAAYERLTGVAGWATHSWNVFGLLVLAAAGVILIGSLVNLSLSLNRQKSASEGEQPHESA
jgi:hypothetical protein